MNRKKTTILDLQAKKTRKEPISMLTAYDYTGAVLVDAAGIDSILIGDSLGMVVMGLESTVPVTMDEMLHHCRAVARGAKYAHLVGDLPFLSYQVSESEAIRNAGLMLKEGNVDSVKLEGGQEVITTVRAIVAAGIPVMGHIGLTPQSVSKLGGYKTQGRTAIAARRLVDDALALEAAGCYAIVLEAVPAPVAEAITERLNIPTIGIGAGPHCDGQVLVYHDILGLYDKVQPRFVKQYLQLQQPITEAFESFRDDVAARKFPTEEHSFAMNSDELELFKKSLKG
ncbi:MAG: 3-methyl-2-oxobutanoate hydroxymethyltransferase [Anaerolineae bacterium]|nr:3-methyl-2-oxobutanoate hydroxymethyltransferase [Anaerolineae bacterium]RIK24265.1 MAG: 3-methyl-2-oxobutanoate hydroxymethyltransferase [Anaerolineae bacterium]